MATLIHVRYLLPVNFHTLALVSVQAIITCANLKFIASITASAQMGAWGKVYVIYSKLTVVGTMGFYGVVR